MVVRVLVLYHKYDRDKIGGWSYNSIMRDLMLIMPDDPKKVSWCLDIDIINGMPKLVPFERNTQDQRAALSAYTFRGTIPGKPDVGINWGGLYENNDETLVGIDNEIKQAIQNNAAIPEGPNGSYVPTYKTAEDGTIGITIYQG